MSRVLLIRHGETPWNRERRWQGHADVELSEEGRRQATELAAHLPRDCPPPAAIYTSDLSRARATAEIVGAAFGLEVLVDPRWREIDVGSWAGLTRDEVEARFPVDWARIVAGEDLPRGGGETFAAFSSRIAAALDDVRRRHGDRLAIVVTHGGAIRAAMMHARSLPVARLREVAGVRNTSLTELAHDGATWRVHRSDDVAHLESAAARLAGAA